MFLAAVIARIAQFSSSYQKFPKEAGLCQKLEEALSSASSGAWYHWWSLPCQDASQDTWCYMAASCVKQCAVSSAVQHIYLFPSCSAGLVEWMRHVSTDQRQGWLMSPHFMCSTLASQPEVALTSSWQAGKNWDILHWCTRSKCEITLAEFPRQWTVPRKAVLHSELGWHRQYVIGFPRRRMHLHFP